MVVLHFADFHIGYTNCGFTDPNTGLHQRIIDFYATACKLAQNTTFVDAVLFAGDAYKTREPSNTLQRMFTEVISIWAKSGVPVVIIPGNHDMHNMPSKNTPMELYKLLGVPNVFVINEPEVVTIDTKSGPLIVAGLPYPYPARILTGAHGETLRGRLQSICYGLAEVSQELSGPNIPRVLMAHLTVDGCITGSEQILSLDPTGGGLTKEDMLVEHYDYVALGHIHRFQDLNEGKYPPVVYSGSLEHIDFSEWDLPKGPVLVNLERGKTTYKHMLIEVRPFVEVTLHEERKVSIVDQFSNFLLSFDGDKSKTVLKIIIHQKVQDFADIVKMAEGFYDVKYSFVSLRERVHSVLKADEAKKFYSMPIKEQFKVYINHRYGDDPDRVDRLLDLFSDIQEE